MGGKRVIFKVTNKKIECLGKDMEGVRPSRLRIVSDYMKKYQSLRPLIKSRRVQGKSAEKTMGLKECEQKIFRRLIDDEEKCFEQFLSSLSLVIKE